MAPGPNDFHFENGVQKPGLGADEPTERQRALVAAGVEAENERLAIIERAEQENEARAVAMDEKQAELEAREAALLAREAALTAAVKTNGRKTGAADSPTA